MADFNQEDFRVRFVGWSVLAAMALTGLWSVHTQAVHRLQWQGSEVAWHRTCAFSHDHPAEAIPHRFCVIQGSLQSLARADASLYAVFLEGPSDLPHLEKTLRTYGAPAGWSDEVLPAGTSETLSVSWVPLAPNGAITLRVDEAHQPGKELVALVNADGEILGTRSLWTTPADSPLFSEARHRAPADTESTP